MTTVADTKNPEETSIGVLKCYRLSRYDDFLPHSGRGGAVGRGRGTGVDLGVGVACGVAVAVAVAVAVGVGVAVGVAVGLGVTVGVGVGVGPDCAQYLPPVLKTLTLLYPPQTIISPPVQTAACQKRASGAPLVLVAVQISVPGSYLPPVFNELAF